MHIKVTKSIFIDAFKAMRPENFSYDALSEMFDYFDDMGSDPDIELDVISICCEYSEYSSIEDYNQQHETEFESKEELSQNCIVIEVNKVRFVAADY